MLASPGYIVSCCQPRVHEVLTQNPNQTIAKNKSHTAHLLVPSVAQFMTSLLPVDFVEMIFSKILLLKMFTILLEKEYRRPSNWNSAFEIHGGLQEG